MNSNTKKWEDYYALLGVSKNATKEEIAKAYKEKARFYHPDRPTGNPVMWKLLRGAYSTLSDDAIRASYDASYDAAKEEYTKNYSLVKASGGQLVEPLNLNFNIPTPTTTPTPTPTPKPKKKWPMIVAGGLAVVLFGTGIYALGVNNGKNKNNNTSLPQNPGISNKFNGKDVLGGLNDGILDKVVIPGINDDEQPEVDDEQPVVDNNKGNGSTTGTPVEKPSDKTETPAETKPSTSQKDDVQEKKVATATATISKNWANFGSPYDDATIEDMIRCLNGMESKMNIENAEGMIEDMVSRAATPAINNALVGSAAYRTARLDLTSILVNGQSGLKWAQAMELHFNGAATDMGNLVIYGERALTDEAILLDKLDGYSVYSLDDASMLIWARLAVGTNGIVGAMDKDVAVEINGIIYTGDDLNDSRLYENVVAEAKRGFGISAKTMS